MPEDREYVKIHSLWKRQGYYHDKVKNFFDKSAWKGESKGDFIVGDYAEPEFPNIRNWRVEEKVDGTNIRIIYKDGKVSIGGRTSAARIPCHLLNYLRDTFNEWLLGKAFPVVDVGGYPDVILFGEGYGAKIQGCGGNYRSDAGFILFDVLVGRWWLKREDVRDIANQLGIFMCPDLGQMTEEEIVNFVKSKPLSRCSEIPQMMEGVVCRSEPLMMFRKGGPIMFKLKCKDFL